MLLWKVGSGDVDNSGMDAGGSSVEPEVETADSLEKLLKNLE